MPGSRDVPAPHCPLNRDPSCDWTKAKIESLRIASLLANENQNASCQRKDGHDNAKTKTEQSHQAAEDQVDCEQEHSEVLGDVHDAFLKQSPSFCTRKITRYKIIYGFLLSTFKAGLLILISALTF